MPTFSQRNGYSSAESAFQRESLDVETRTRLWNCLCAVLWNHYGASYETTEEINSVVRKVWSDLLNLDLDEMPKGFRTSYTQNGVYEMLKSYFFESSWWEAFDFLEYLVAELPGFLQPAAIRSQINAVLERHSSAYRFVSTQITEITDPIEIAAIEEALRHPENPVRIHLQAALQFLSDRESPDYRNSVKESISAVEAACRRVCGDPRATLGDALKRVKNIHPAMQAAMVKLYGYTSDAEGIRHSLTDEPSITYADTKFMLVACAGFVSYLAASADAP